MQWPRLPQLVPGRSDVASYRGHHDQDRDHFQRVYTMLQRAQIDLKEGFARKAGALFIAYLKQSDLWEALAETPPHRVGTCPEPAEGVAPIDA